MIILYLIFRSTIHFKLIFVYGVRQGSSFILLHVDTQCSRHQFVEKMIHSPLKGLGTLAENELALSVKTHVRPRSVWDGASLSQALWLWLESRNGEVLSSPILFFCSKTVSATLGPWHFLMNFRVRLSISWKAAAGILIWIVQNLQINLGSTAAALAPCSTDFIFWFHCKWNCFLNSIFWEFTASI